MEKKIDKLVEKRTGGLCPAKELTINNVREKCAFDFI